MTLVWSLSLNTAADGSAFTLTYLAWERPQARSGLTGLRKISIVKTEVRDDVKKATSFAIRLAARGEPAPVRDFLARHVPPQDPAATGVLCDAIRRLTKKLLPQFAPLLPRYEQWAADPALSGRERRSVESAVKILQSVQI
jgi:hypothetical protein